MRYATSIPYTKEAGRLYKKMKLSLDKDSLTITDYAS